jgi:ubiquitin fusion degradation protein 1
LGISISEHNRLLWHPAVGDTIVEDEPKFKPFTGSGKRLDGRASKLQASELPSSTLSAPSDSNKRANQQTATPATAGASSSTRQKAGKLVFGSSASNKEQQKVFPTAVNPEICSISHAR